MWSEVPIARRNLMADKAKLLVALGGVSLAVALILVVQSIYQGVRQDFAFFIRNLPGDVWVAQKGVTGLTYSNALLTESDAEGIRQVPGVTAVHRLYGRIASFQTGGDEDRVYVWALAPGGTLTLAEQRTLPQPGTILIDRSYARQAGVSPGDLLSYEGSELAVADVRRIGNLLIIQFAFIHHEDYLRLFGELGPANFFLVSLGTDATSDTIDEIAQQAESYSVYATDEFVGVGEEPARNFLPIVRVIAAMSFIVGLALLSMMIYSATIEREREYGIMKVLGASPWRLYRIVLGQSAIIAAPGFGVGVGLAFLFNRLAGDLAPELVTYIRWQDVALTFGLAAFMTFVASFLPINRVARVEPASVFRA